MAELATGIDQDPEKQGGEPCIADTRIPVRRVGHLVEREAYSPQEVAEHYDIRLSDVYRALAYYYDHPDEMETYDQRDRDRERQAADSETLSEARGRLQNDT